TQSCAFVDLAAAAEESTRTARLVLRPIQSHIWKRHTRICKLVPHRNPKGGGQFCFTCRARGRRRFFWIEIAEQFFARGRSRVHVHRASTARCRFAAAHRSSLSRD